MMKYFRIFSAVIIHKLCVHTKALNMVFDLTFASKGERWDKEELLERLQATREAVNQRFGHEYDDDFNNITVRNFDQLGGE